MNKHEVNKTAERQDAEDVTKNEQNGMLETSVTRTYERPPQTDSVERSDGTSSTTF